LRGKINNIQVLRAFAALVVAITHTGYHFPSMHPFGSFGVDVFFVISGYVMARICDGDTHFFFRRRVLRIVPPYWAVTLVLFIFALFYPELLKATRSSPVELIKSLFFIPFEKSNGLIQPLLFPGWSLNYEMFFYVVLGASLLIYRRHALWLSAGIIILTIIICNQFADQSVIARFYARDLSLEFIFGLIAYHVSRVVAQPTAVRLRVPMLVLFIASMAGLVMYQGLLPHNDIPRSIPLGGLSFLLVTSAAMLSEGGWDTNAAFLVLVGDASYILYLIHPYCEYLIGRVIAKHVQWLTIDTALGMVVAVGITITAAILLHVQLERPTIAFLNRHFGGKRKSAEFAPPAAAAPPTASAAPAAGETPA
jgi:exopolysaccharide production protein ExoZ